MKFIQKIGWIAVCVCLMQASRHSPDSKVFWASTPCDALPRAVLSVPATADCELIKWNVALQYDPRTGVPTLFTLRYTYGMSKPSTEDLKNGGTTGVLEGKWASVTVNRNRVVYRLTPNTSPNQPLEYLRLQNNLLHLLDRDGKLMVGHSGWSYTLNGK